MERKLSLAQVSEKWKEKLASQKIGCPLAKLSSFFGNCFPRILIIVSTNRKIAPIKKQFSLDRESFSTSQVKDLLKNTETLLQL